MTTLPRTADIAVIGGGAYGLSAALWLRRLRPDLSVLLLDRSDFAGNETGRCGAGFRAQWGAAGNIRLCQESLPFYESFAEEFGYPEGIEFKQDGYLILAHGEEQLDQLRRNIALQARFGVDSTLLTAEEVARLAPGLNPAGVVGGSFCARDGSLSPFRVLDGFHRAAVRSGVIVRHRVTIDFIEPRNGAFRLRAGGGAIEAGRVVVATDTRIPQLLGPLGIDIPVQPYPNQAFVTEPLPPRLGPCVVSFAHEMFLNQTVRGSVVVVASDRRRALGADAQPTADLFPRAAAHAIDLLPALGTARLLRSWGGLYSITPDMLAVLGETALPGLFVALSGAKGFMTAPAAGRLLAQLVDGQAVPDWFARLSPARFASGEELEKEPAIV
ncbi:NAD(P)/FAD-dependent oxidoreductase [Azospirillum argentinense]